jgi:hypothetical protein
MKMSNLVGPRRQVPGDESRIEERADATNEAEPPALGSDGSSRFSDLRVLDNGL